MTRRRWWAVTALVAVVPGGLAVAASIALYRYLSRKRQLRRCEQELRDMGIKVEEHAKWARA